MSEEKIIIIAKDCPDCKGSGSRFGWIGLIVFYPIHFIYNIFFRSLSIFYFTGMVILTFLIVVTDVNFFLALLVAILSFVVTKILLLHTILCKYCKGSGSAECKDEPFLID